MQMMMEDSEVALDSRQTDNSREEFYNPVPAKHFSKQSQPSLAFKATALAAEKPGIELYGVEGTQMKKKAIYTRYAYKQATT